MRHQATSRIESLTACILHINCWYDCSQPHSGLYRRIFTPQSSISMDNGFPENNVVYAASADLAYDPGTHTPIPRRNREAKSFQRGFARRNAAKQSVAKRLIDFAGST